jgi:hypothetical protein
MPTPSSLVGVRPGFALAASVLLLPAWPAVAGDPPPSGKTPGVQGMMAAVSADRVQRTVEVLAGFGTRHTLSDTTSPTRGIGAARNWIREELRAAGVKADLEMLDVASSARIPRGGTIANVVGVLPGTTSPERAVYLVAHYDSRNADIMDATGDAPGANDDGSGTAAVIEIARVIGNRPQECTIVFLLTSGEEQSLAGAGAHVAALGADEARPRPIAVLNNDIIGEPYGPGPDRAPITRNLVRVFSEGLPRNPPAEHLAEIRLLSGESDLPSRQLARYIAEIARREDTPVKPMLVFRLDRFLRGGDHTPFVERGYAAVRFTEVDEDFSRQHANVTHKTLGDGSTVVVGDTPDSIDSGYIADVARLNLAATLHLANAPSPPRKVRIVTAQLSNDTTLRWREPEDKDVAGIELVWRLTTEAEWTGVKDLGLVEEVTVPMNKDNYFFGVRAYDRDGYRSMVVFPNTGRD